MANIKDVAKRAGVAVSTVSKYINGGTVRGYNAEAIKEAIEALDFKINDVARSLKTSKAMTVGILIPSLESTFFTSIASIMEDRFMQDGYGIILCDYRNDDDLEKDKLEFLISKRVDGLAIVPQQNPEFLKSALALKIPIVAIDRAIAGIDSVVSDSYEGAKKATEYLINMGHKEIAIICGPENINTSKARYSGYFDALSDNDIKVKPEYVLSGNYTLEGGYTQMCKFLELKKLPTAVFATNYEMTMGAMMALNEKGVSVPEAMSVIGFDNMAMTQIINPPLTVVAQPLEKIGVQSAEILLGKMENEEVYDGSLRTIKTELIIRESVKNIN